MGTTAVAVLMGCIFLGIVLVDIWLAIDNVDDNTFSARLKVWAKVWPPTRLIVTFGLGLLTGHWFW